MKPIYSIINSSPASVLATLLISCLSITSAFGQLQSQKDNPVSKSSVDLAELIQNRSSSDFVITAEHQSRISGTHHIYIRQAINGLEVYGTESSVHINSEGKVIQVHNNFVNEINSTMKSTAAGITASDAIMSVSRQMGYNVSGLKEIERKGGINQSALYNKAGISSADIPVKLMYYYREGHGTQMVWELSVQELTSSDWWNFRVDATNGNIIDKDNWTVSCFVEGEHFDHDHGPANPLVEVEGPMRRAEGRSVGSALQGTYNVFPIPYETPNHAPGTARVLVSNPDDPTASPNGWVFTTGGSANHTIGNNCDAYEDSSNPVSGTGSGSNSERAFGGPGLNFDFTLDLNVNNNGGSQDAAVTNLFYWTNIIHDLNYFYGFDEVSGNFQEDNFGIGGLGGDSVFSEAQDGSGTCNANFGTPPDGSNPRMQMYVCGTRDGDLDNGVIVHEYGHGISNRLTGGPAASGCLGNTEQMGEGWSDYLALMMTMQTGDAGTDSRGIGTWLVGQSASGPGIRPTPYSTNFGVNASTYDTLKNTGTISVPHGVGYVWATMLWEMTWDLIAIYGFDSDLYTGTGGNNIALQLVTEGLKLQPCSPGFVDGRDAILQADMDLYGGANQCTIWQAFARRGLGFSASQGSNNSRTDGTEAFDLPPAQLTLTTTQVCLSEGTINGIGGGGFLAGGSYSGPGVTDDGNGTTFTFDATVAGIGSHTITYTETCNSPSQSATDTLEVIDSTLALTCPSDIVANADPGNCEAVVDYIIPEPTGGCSRSSIRLTQNTDETNNNGVDCSGDTSGHLRQFDLNTLGVTRDYGMTGVDVAINSTTGANITVNVYLANMLPNAITTYTVPISSTVTPYATTTSAVPAGSSFTHFVPLNVFLPAGSAFTVEVISPSTQDFMIGYNDSGVLNTPNDTAIGYTSCQSSPLPYSDLADFNLGANSVLISIQGTESNSLTTVQTAGLPPGSTFEGGTTTNTFVTTDSNDGSTVNCSFDVTVNGATVTEYIGGAWNNGTPAAGFVARIRDDYNTATDGSIDACSCEIDATRTLTVGAGDYLNTSGGITVNGTLVVEHQGSVVQQSGDVVTVNNGTINVELTTPVLQTRDFMVMGSPMTTETRTGVFNSAFLVLEHTPGNFVPHPSVPAGGTNFADDNGDFWNQFASGPINIGEGYIVRPQSSFTDPANTTYDFIYDQGTLNNGDVSRNIIFNGLGSNPDGTPNVLSNPYASAIFADDFINANTLVNEVYFWEHLTPPLASTPGARNINFSMDDISMYNLSGGTAAANDPGTSTEPDGFISTGQGFGIKAFGAGIVTFDNSMRRTTNNNTLRNSVQPIDRIWLRVENKDYNLGSNTLLAFDPFRTEGLDPGYDSNRLATVISLYSQLPDGSEELGIQTREAFDMDMQIPFGFTSQAESDLTYTISIMDLEGLNITEAVVYLIDNELNRVTNLSDGDYTFRTGEGNFKGRFTLQFRSETLGAEEFTETAISIYPNPSEGLLNISSTASPITGVRIFDLQGRLIQTEKMEGETAVQFELSSLVSAMYFIEIETESGTVTKRLIKR